MIVRLIGLGVAVCVGVTALGDAAFRIYAKESDLYRWPERAVTVRIDSRGATQADVDAAWRGLQQWNTVLARDGQPVIRVQYGKIEGKADISVRFVGAEGFTGNQVGITRTTFRSRDRLIRKAEIDLMRIGTKRWYEDTDLEATAAHEMGHALGIGTHSPDRRDLMAAMNGNRLSLSDAATLRRAYGTPAR